MMNNYKISVFTPTYNRGYCLRRVFDSLMAQTSKSFNWIIVDDGSTDETSSLIDDFITKADFEICYVWQQNGGRHVAFNKAIDICSSDYIISIDSDDELLPDAIESIYKAIDLIPVDKRESIWQLSFLCVDENNKLVGKRFPSKINTFTGRKQHKMYLRAKGEKSCCRRVDILKQYPFPVFDDTKFVTESIVWERIHDKFDSFCFNKPIRIYHTDSSDGLMANSGKSISRLKSSWYAAQIFINEHFDQFFYNKNIVFSLLNYNRISIILRLTYREQRSFIKPIMAKIIMFFTYPLIFLYVKINKKQYEKIQ